MITVPIRDFTVNNGFKKEYNGWLIEISPYYKHNPNMNIICTYFCFPAEPGIINQLTFYRSIKDDSYGFELYKFKGRNSQHYWSRNYEKGVGLPVKYKDVGYMLYSHHPDIDFESFRSVSNTKDIKISKHVVSTETIVKIVKVEYKNEVAYFSVVITGPVRDKISSLLNIYSEYKATSGVRNDKITMSKLDLMDLRMLKKTNPAVKIELEKTPISSNTLVNKICATLVS